MASKRPFGHANRGGTGDKTSPPDRAPSSVEALSPEEYERLVQPLRQGSNQDAEASDGGLLALFTTSRYRYWLWIGAGAMLMLLVQIVGFGDRIVPDDVGSTPDIAATVESADGAVEITSVAIDGEPAGDGTVGFGGELINHAEGTVVGLVLALTLYDCLDGSSENLESCARHDEIMVSAEALVPPEASGSFHGSVSLDDFPAIEGVLEVTYRIDSVEVN